MTIPDTQYYSESYPATFTAQTTWIRDTAATLNTVFVTHLGDITDGATPDASGTAPAPRCRCSTRPASRTALVAGQPRLARHRALRRDLPGEPLLGERLVRRVDARPGQPRQLPAVLGRAGSTSSSSTSSTAPTPASGPGPAGSSRPTPRGGRSWSPTTTSTRGPEPAPTAGDEHLDRRRDLRTATSSWCSPVTPSARPGRRRRTNSCGDTGPPGPPGLPGPRERRRRLAALLHVQAVREQDLRLHLQGAPGRQPRLVRDRRRAASSPSTTTWAAAGALQVIGTDTGVASGGHATIDWPGSRDGTEYEWYVDVSDGSLTTTGPTWSFTTTAASATFPCRHRHGAPAARASPAPPSTPSTRSPTPTSGRA